MPLLIIAGITRSIVQRNPGYTPKVDGWNVELIGSLDKRRPDLHTCWRDALSAAEKDEQGAHIFAYHYREDEYRFFNRQMRDSHRLVWMDKDTLNSFGSDLYLSKIQGHIDFEVQWREKLRPQSTSAPSLLPESSFSPKRYEDLWERIRTARFGRDDLQRIHMRVRAFRRTHYHRGHWEDDRGLHFKAAPERHGSCPIHGSTKFTYRLPEGFHYNVQNSRHNRRFSVRNSEGIWRSFTRYTNIDCHGHIRGGD